MRTRARAIAARAARQARGPARALARPVRAVARYARASLSERVLAAAAGLALTTVGASMVWAPLGLLVPGLVLMSVALGPLALAQAAEFRRARAGVGSGRDG